MNWQIGDRAIVHSLVDDVEYNGAEITLLGINVSARGGEFFHLSDLNAAQFRSQNLRPISDDNAKKKTQWDEIVDANNNCIFTPRELVTV